MTQWAQTMRFVMFVFMHIGQSALYQTHNKIVGSVTTVVYYEKWSCLVNDLAELDKIFCIISSAPINFVSCVKGKKMRIGIVDKWEISFTDFSLMYELLTVL